jgi:hypothetical protein
MTENQNPIITVGLDNYYIDINAQLSVFEDFYIYKDFYISSSTTLNNNNKITTSKKIKFGGLGYLYV